MLIIISGCILIFPLLLILGVHPEHGLDLFMGGLSWQAVIYGIWESVMCIFMSLLVLSLFMKYSGLRLIRNIAPSAYTVYIIHPPLLILCTYVFLQLDLHPLLKFVLTGTCSIFLGFTLAARIRRLPLLKRIL